MTDGLFAGWYYDAALENAAGGNEAITRNLTLYARLDRSTDAAQATQVATAESPNSVTDTVEAVNVDDYTFAISGYTGDYIESFVNTEPPVEFWMPSVMWVSSFCFGHVSIGYVTSTIMLPAQQMPFLMLVFLPFVLFYSYITVPRCTADV